jgi:hypothetical protein
MKISIEDDSQISTITIKSDCVEATTLVDMFKGLMMSHGYHPITVDDVFKCTNTWFPERDEETYNQCEMKYPEDFDGVHHIAKNNFNHHDEVLDGDDGD